MKNKNYLNVFNNKPSYKWFSSYFFKNLKHVFGTFKCAWQRATKGYCYRDLWNLDHFYTNMVAETLESYLISSGGCHPNDYENSEEWEAEVRRIITLQRDAMKDTSDEFTYGTSVEEMRARWKEQADEQAEVFAWLAEHLHQLWN